MFVRLPGDLPALTMSAAHSGRGFHAPTTCRLPPSVLRLVLADITPGHVTSWPRLESVCPWAQVAALTGSPVAEAARDILSAADNSWREVEPVLAQAEEVCPLSRAVPGMQCLASPWGAWEHAWQPSLQHHHALYCSWGQSLGQTHELMQTSMLGYSSMENGAWLLCPDPKTRVPQGLHTDPALCFMVDLRMFICE